MRPVVERPVDPEGALDRPVAPVGFYRPVIRYEAPVSHHEVASPLFEVDPLQVGKIYQAGSGDRREEAAEIDRSR